ncbi:Bro-N domain-containing protein [Arsenophonus nasoniae]|uniref:BRO-N domain-containing protein n=1 Tax=Arsenophonus nasoniae TaxID=638 RepID=UPI003879AFCD
MAALSISFSFKETHNVRIKIIDAEPWFCLKDVCEVLTITNSRRVASEVLDQDGVRKTYITDSIGREQEAAFVNEPNLYRVIFRSNKPEAKQFQDWLFNEVLPSIRKTGKYEHPKHQPEARELLTADDTSHLSRLIWTMANGFRFERSWTQGIWYALRHATGVESPQHFEVNQIPIIAKECEKIYNFTNGVKEAIYEAEKQAVRRVLRKREDADKVLAEIKQLFEESNQEHTFVLTDTLTRWQQAEIQQFLQRS